MTVLEMIARLGKEDPEALVLGEYDGTLFELSIVRTLRVNKVETDYISSTRETSPIVAHYKLGASPDSPFHEDLVGERGAVLLDEGA